MVYLTLLMFVGILLPQSVEFFLATTGISQLCSPGGPPLKWILCRHELVSNSNQLQLLVKLYSYLTNPTKPY